MKFNLEFLKDMGMEDDAIDFIERNKLHLYDINKINGHCDDVEDYFEIIKSALKDDSYKCDENGNIIQAKQADDSIIEYEYNNENKLIKKIYLVNNEIHVSYEFDNKGRIKKEENQNFSVEYEYDDHENIINMIFSEGTVFTHEYKYNENGMLIEIINNGESIVKIE